MGRAWLPLGVFALLVGLLYVGLSLDPKRVPSPFIDKPAPEFEVTQLHNADLVFNNELFKGKVSLFNVWATWCVSCRQEHPVLVELAKTGKVDIYGLNYKDERNAAQRWLKQFGNPYVASAFDADGRVGIDWGVYGVPETFVIDKNGIVRHKHIGPVSWQDLTQDILPLIDRLNKEG